ncbi:hypothetical protein [Chryseosolibacter indicus]|uniref:Uncharacterized protein n=1 Tax=Chryseosolibacter indicus TaxID=2782351 RepID=A0ABS5VPI1_9BACT|nr:hypothetical protein [Chryseosolibacter indicus]MBT1703323.1 hypothetical protein [Chryseosolibacter indicus]
MGQTSFNNLSIQDKVLLIEDIGIELCSIEFYDHRIFLYAFDTLLIEIYKNIETKKVESITVASFGDLDKFTSRITLPHSLRTKQSGNSIDLIY